MLQSYENIFCVYTKIMTLFNNFFSSVSVFDVLSQQYRCQMDYFINVLTTFLGLDRGSSLAVYAGLERSRISSQKP